MDNQDNYQDQVIDMNTSNNDLTMKENENTAFLYNMENQPTLGIGFETTELHGGFENADSFMDPNAR